MRDIPDIYRYAAIALLVFSLLLILKGLGGGLTGFVPGPVEPGDDKTGKKVAAEMDLYPPLPKMMPDLNDGYIFNKERHFEEDDTSGVWSLGPAGSIDLNEIVYSGSLIVGDVRKALITYQEMASTPKPVANRRTAGRQPRKSRAKKTYQHKQLDPGEDFMGYKVAKIESDRIVFERGSEKIEKFLFDGSKDRVVVKTATRTVAPKTSGAGRTVPPAATSRRQSPPPAKGTAPPPVTPRAAKPPVTTRPDARNTPPASASRRSRRSQRFLGLDPSVLAQPPAASPQNQTEPR